MPVNSHRSFGHVVCVCVLTCGNDVPIACRTVCRLSFSISVHPIPTIISDETICAPYSRFAIRKTETGKWDWMQSLDCDSPAPVHGCRPILPVTELQKIDFQFSMRICRSHAIPMPCGTWHVYWFDWSIRIKGARIILTSGNWYFSLIDLCRWSSLVLWSSLPLKYLTNT